MMTMVKVGMMIKIIGLRLTKFIADVCWDDMTVDAVTNDVGKNIDDDNGEIVKLTTKKRGQY